MEVIHFTRGRHGSVARPTRTRRPLGPLADGSGYTHVGCVHFDPGSRLESPKTAHGAALLVVHGRIEVTGRQSLVKISVHAGMGVVFAGDEACVLESSIGAFALTLEADAIVADPCGVSTPARIMGQRWPSDELLRG